MYIIWNTYNEINFRNPILEERSGTKGRRGETESPGDAECKEGAAKIFIKKQELKLKKPEKNAKLQDIYIQEWWGIALKGTLTGLDKNEHLLKINTLVTSKM